jgi:hypothetical protein
MGSGEELTCFQITLLKIAVKDIEPKMKWEPSGSYGVFPHVYWRFRGRLARHFPADTDLDTGTCSVVIYLRGRPIP